MSSAQCSREFLSEEENGRQRGLQDIKWDPRIELYRIELPQHACKKEEEEEWTLADQQFCDQERNSSLKQEESEPREIKEEPDEVCTSQEGEQFLLKQEEDTFTLGIDLRHQHFCKEEEVTLQVDQQGCVQNSNSSPNQVEPVSVYIKEEQEELLTCQEGELLVLKHETKSFSISPTGPKNDLTDEEPNRDDFPVDERSNLEGSKLKSSGPTRHSELKPKKSYQRTRDDGENSSLLKNHCNTQCRVGKQDSGKACGKQLMTSESNFTVLGRTCRDVKPYSCKTCGKCFSQSSHLSAHRRIHTGERPYSCKTCGKCFGHSSHLSAHRRIHTGERPYSCKTCGQCFMLKGNMLRHMRTHTNEKPYSCGTCGKGLATKWGLLCHMMIHTGAKPHCCKTCGKCFIKKFNLLTHMEIHTDKTSYQLCRKINTTNTALRYHVSIHTGDKLYSCKTCGKRFLKNSWLMAHMRTHEKLYCQTCGKHFLKNSCLLAHMRTHTGEKLFSCKTCGKSFTANSSLSTHMRIHTGAKPYFCKTCGMCFSTNSNLSAHMRVHTGEKPYSCKTCGKGLSRNSILLTHMRSHTGEKPYSCKTCGRSFTTNKSLKSHVKLHTD